MHGQYAVELNIKISMTVQRGMCKQVNMVDMKQPITKNKINIKNKISYDIKTQKVLCANVHEVESNECVISDLK